MTRTLKALMLATHVGLFACWLLTALFAIGAVSVPGEWLFSDYRDPIVISWNWSFLPLDFVLSVAGIVSISLHVLGDARWLRFAFVSLSMTSCAGLMAISFWIIRGDFDVVWWAINLFLMLWPAPYLMGGLGVDSTRFVRTQ